MRKLSYGIGAAALLSLGACAEGPANNVDNFGYEGTGISFGVSPLTLDSLSDACYSFAIENEAGQLVVGRGPETASLGVTGTALNSICASQFGNSAGGDISYVAPCDASVGPTDDVNPVDGENTHTVTLWVDRLCKTSTTPITFDANGFPAAAACTEMQAYVDPCPTGCELPVNCEENADTPVEFNFTIMGQADQGFFDIAVNFDDVFCSAKLDDCNSAGDKIQLMFDAAGNRINTVVAAVSCTAGPGTSVDTVLNFTSLQIDCGADGGLGTLALNTVTQEGNLLIGSYPSAVYYGTEALPDMNKVYTTVAIGVDDAAACSFQWQVAPSNGAFAAADETGVYTSYGYVNFEASDLGGATCHENPLNGVDAEGNPTSAVTTAYATGTELPAGLLNTFLTEDAADGTTARFSAFP